MDNVYSRIALLLRQLLLVVGVDGVIKDGVHGRQVARVTQRDGVLLELAHSRVLVADARQQAVLLARTRDVLD
jgi:hypothetical protein